MLFVDFYCFDDEAMQHAKYVAYRAGLLRTGNAWYLEAFGLIGSEASNMCTQRKANNMDILASTIPNSID